MIIETLRVTYVVRHGDEEHVFHSEEVAKLYADNIGASPSLRVIARIEHLPTPTPTHVFPALR